MCFTPAKSPTLTIGRGTKQGTWRHFAKGPEPARNPEKEMSQFCAILTPPKQTIFIPPSSQKKLFFWAFLGTTSPKKRLKAHFWTTNCQKSFRHFEANDFQKTDFGTGPKPPHNYLGKNVRAIWREICHEKRLCRGGRGCGYLRNLDEKCSPMIYSIEKSTQISCLPRPKNFHSTSWIAFVDFRPALLDVSNRHSRFAAIQIAIGSQRFQIAQFEPQGQKPFETLLRLYYFFTFQTGFKSRD